MKKSNPVSFLERMANNFSASSTKIVLESPIGSVDLPKKNDELKDWLELKEKVYALEIEFPQQTVGIGGRREHDRIISK